MWITAIYRASSLFSLKPANATASGGRTLLVPTPYAVKMALLDVACRLIGQEAAAQAWDDWLGDVPVALKPTPDVVVNKTFIKILRPPKRPQPGQPFQQTIAYREYAQLAGDLGVALEVETDGEADAVGRWLAHINYLGKRGSFMHLRQRPQVLDELPADWIVVNEAISSGFALDSVLTQLDDTGMDADFEKVSIYSGKRMTLGKQRVLHHVALPYDRVRTSRTYTHYRLKPE